jgi:DHA2 family multidrug resistance protein
VSAAETNERGGTTGSRSAAGGHNPWLIASIVSIATFMQVLDTSIANVSLRHIAGGLAASYQESTWIVTSYLVASAVILPVSGWLSTVIGRKRYYMLSVVLFSASSLLCGLAPNLGMLVVFRVLQGLGGGGLAPSEQSILADTFPAQKRGQAFALYGVTVVVAPTIGPTLGGFITDTFSWHWIFLINVPIGLLSLALTGAFLSEPAASSEQRRELLKNGLKIDYVGFLLIAIGLGALEVVMDRGQELGWLSSGFIIAFGLLAIACLVAFVPWELSRPDPIVDIRLFANRQFAICCAALLATGILIFSTIQLLPQLLQETMNYSATSAGLAMTPGGFATLAELPVTAYLLKSVQPRYIVAVGMAIEAVALWHMSGLSLGMGFDNIAWARVYQAFGLAFLFVPITTAAYGRLKPDQTNQASALMNVARNLGGSIGIAAAQSIIAVQTTTYTAALMSQATPPNGAAQTIAGGIGTTVGAPAIVPGGLSLPGLQVLARELGRQASMLAYTDVFRLLAIMAAILVPAALSLRNVELGK